MIEISEAENEDLEEVLKLQKLAYQSEAKLYNDWSLPALTQSVESLYEESLGSVILKAVIDGNIIGSVRAKTTKSTCEIGRLIVHPNFQRKGVGSKLLKTIENMHLHLQRFELFTGSISIDNIRLYEKHGYKITHTKPLSNTVSITYLEKYVDLRNLNN